MPGQTKLRITINMRHWIDAKSLLVPPKLSFPSVAYHQTSRWNLQWSQAEVTWSSGSRGSCRLDPKDQPRSASVPRPLVAGPPEYLLKSYSELHLDDAGQRAASLKDQIDQR